MNYRHEWKHEISYGDLLTLRMRLSAVMQSDSHAIGNKYEIRSLYFDTPSDRALRKKSTASIAGQNSASVFTTGTHPSFPLKRKAR